MVAPLRILVSGMIAADPRQGGATWAVLQYVLGLRRLGHDVLFVEQIAPEKLRPAGATLAASDNAAYFNEVVGEFCLKDRAALVASDGQANFGMEFAELRRFSQSADLLLNLSGILSLPALLERVERRVYVDLDPGFTQIWHESQGLDLGFDRHTHFVTIGMKIGAPSCSIPTCNRRWIVTPQPIVLEHWPMADGAHDGVFTTVGHWRSYGSFTYRGQHYGQKAHSLRKLIQLPTLVDKPFVLAMSIHPDETEDIRLLARHGWIVSEPSQKVGSPATYRGFIAGSMAELGVAKSGYIAADCGWFSDRSLCYLASGRPVVAQETGFTSWLPTGRGLLAFSDCQTARGACEEVCRNYARHRSAAREIATTWFDSDRVLGNLLDGLAVP